jgi:hypothetical protein
MNKIMVLVAFAAFVIVFLAAVFFFLTPPTQRAVVSQPPAATTTAATSTAGATMYAQVQSSANPLKNAPVANPLKGAVNPFATSTPAPYQNPFSQ